MVLFQASIAVSKTLFGDVDFNGTLFVDDDEDDDWVTFFLFWLPSHSNKSFLSNYCTLGRFCVGNGGHQPFLHAYQQQAKGDSIVCL